MATDLSRLNMAFGEEPGTKASSPSISSMQTDRDSSGGCSSPTLSECFNPFDSPRVHPREQPYLTGAGAFHFPSSMHLPYTLWAEIPSVNMLAARMP